ncbi:MAG: methyltransferase domain-containing protein, partial [Treponemataceae bacterium]|nr:methyltransferase domain-containing protein [Treponemataceae bacterium]
IILDRFQTKKEELSFWRQWGPVVGIDEGGAFRASFDYLIDSIPSLPPRFPPNLFFPQALGVPSVRRFSWPEQAPPYLRMLVTFGAEDPRGLSVPVARLLLASRWGTVTLVVGPRNQQGIEKIRKEFADGGVEILYAPANLKDLLASYDLVFTHYGLTAYEALFARVPVVLLNPTPYHHRLARWHGFYSLGVAHGAVRRLKSLTHAPLERHFSFPSLFVRRKRGPFGLSVTRGRVPFRDALYFQMCTASKQTFVRFTTAGIGKSAVLSSGSSPTSSSRGTTAALSRGMNEQVSVTEAYNEGLPTLNHVVKEHQTPASLEDLLSHWIFPGEGRCPLCGHRPSPSSRAQARFSDRTYFRCVFCGMTYMVRPQLPAIYYDGDYFGEEYKKQYGRTYLEDFPYLKNMARERLRRLIPLLGKYREQTGAVEDASLDKLKGSRRDPALDSFFTGFPHEQESQKPTLLDIGCAYGPFLDAAREQGFSCFGMDPSSDGIRYVQNTLGIPAVQAFFPQEDPRQLFGRSSFDVITLWYVVEHFPNLREVLYQINACLPIGGVFAFSTPSLSGISGRTNLYRFLEKSPPDHWTLWDPRKTAAFLTRFGFKLVNIQSTGHHPERFPWIGALAGRALSTTQEDTGALWRGLYRFLLRASRVVRLGDTFEAYAIKIQHLDSR